MKNLLSWTLIFSVLITFACQKKETATVQSFPVSGSAEAEFNRAVEYFQGRDFEIEEMDMGAYRVKTNWKEVSVNQIAKWGTLPDSKSRFQRGRVSYEVLMDESEELPAMEIQAHLELLFEPRQSSGKSFGTQVNWMPASSNGVAEKQLFAQITGSP